MRVVYVVTDNSSDVYSHMALNSIAALRILHPDWSVSVFCDEEHALSAGQAERRLESASNEYRPIRVPLKRAVDRSRWLKTNLRNLLDGTFLFIDCDAIPISPLSRIESFPGDACMALDLNLPANRYKIHPKVIELYHELGWKVPSQYFNSGVMLWRDTEDARRLATKWHELWQTTQKLNRLQDQPALNAAITLCRCNVSVLPAKYNAMVERENWGKCRPAIVHFLNHDKHGEFVLAELVRHSQVNQEVDGSTLNHFIETGFPWINPASASRQLACGRYGAAAYYGFRALLEGPTRS